MPEKPHKTALKTNSNASESSSSPESAKDGGENDKCLFFFSFLSGCFQRDLVSGFKDMLVMGSHNSRLEGHGLLIDPKL